MPRAILAKFPTLTILVLLFLASADGYAEQKKAAVSTDSKDSYSIQLNAFVDKKNAEKFVETMKAKGYQPFIVTSEKGKVLYKVLMGPYPSQSKASQTAKILGQKEGLKAIVVFTSDLSHAQDNSDASSEVRQTAKLKPLVRTPPSQVKKEKNEKKTVVSKKQSRASGATSKTQYGSTDIVASIFLQWIRAWQSRDVETYLQFYSDNFAYVGESLEAWKSARRTALAENKEIKIDISDIQIVQTGDTVEMSFVQRYKSEKYTDKGKKTLTWTKEGDSWKITREVWLAI